MSNSCLSPHAPLQKRVLTTHHAASDENAERSCCHNLTPLWVTPLPRSLLMYEQKLFSKSGASWLTLLLQCSTAQVCGIKIECSSRVCRHLLQKDVGSTALKGGAVALTTNVLSIQQCPPSWVPR